MNDGMLKKGEELGLWSAESFESEDEQSLPSGLASIVDFPVIRHAREDNVALGGIILGSVAVVAGATNPREMFSDGWAKGLIYGGAALAILTIGRISMAFRKDAEIVNLKAEVYHTERLFDAMDEEKELEKKEAALDAQHRIFDIGGGAYDSMHPLLGSNLTMPMGGPTLAPVMGQDPVARRRTAWSA